ncbi:MAG: hypothetical protein WC003_05640 [Terrimicrobiaceae bacterium]
MSAQFVSSLVAAEKLAREERLTESRARKLIAEIVERTTGERLNFFTVRGWFEDWIAGKKISKADATGVRYSNAVTLFLESLGDRADKNIETLRPADITRFFKAEREKGKSLMTCVLNVKVVKMALRSATKMAGLKQNPADGFEMPKEEGESVDREVFTPDGFPVCLAPACPVAGFCLGGRVMIAHRSGAVRGGCQPVR